MRKKLFLFLGGMAAGFLNGLLGTGGGILAVQVFRRAGMTQRESQRRSTAFMLAMCAVSLAVLGAGGGLKIDGTAALLLSLGGVPGALLGARLLGRLSDGVLQKIFAALMLISGIRMLF